MSVCGGTVRLSALIFAGQSIAIRPGEPYGTRHKKPGTQYRSEILCADGTAPLRKRLASEDRQRLIEDFLDGALQKDLATQYAIGLSSVKAILRESGARSTRPAGSTNEGRASAGAGARPSLAWKAFWPSPEVHSVLWMAWTAMS
jgi:hypothetical protein